LTTTSIPCFGDRVHGLLQRDDPGVVADVVFEVQADRTGCERRSRRADDIAVAAFDVSGHG
jgi:hypothetical protein